MSSLFVLLAASLLASSVLARPNVTPTAIKARQAAANGTANASGYEDSYEAAVSEYLQTAVPTAKAALSSELAYQSSIEAAYDAADSAFFRTAAPTAKAAYSSDLAAESSWYASLTKDFATHTIGTSEAAAQSSEYAELTSAIAVYETYTGTSDLFPYGTIETGATLAPSEAAALSQEYAQWTATATAWDPAVAPTAAASGGWPDLRVVDEPEVYGVQCLRPRTKKPTYQPADCAAALTEVCTSLKAANQGSGTVDQWIWARGDSEKGCVLSYWLPKVAVGTGRVPTADECKTRVYGEMLSLCFEGSQAGINEGARVNLVHGILNDTSGGYIPGESYEGEQVDASAPSYQVAFTDTDFPTQLTWG